MEPGASIEEAGGDIVGAVAELFSLVGCAAEATTVVELELSAVGCSDSCASSGMGKFNTGARTGERS